VFNLTGKRYLFLLISLIIIVPGTISMIFMHFDVGVDFGGDSSLEFRPALKVDNSNIQQITKTLEGLGLKDVQVNIGDDSSTAKNLVAWVQLNTQIDNTVENAIQKDIQAKWSDATVTPDPLQITTNGKTTTVTVITIANKKSTLNAKDIETVLNKIPDTTNPDQTSSTVSPALTPTATTAATATATTTATATPTATATSTTSTSSTSAAGNIPVHVEHVQVGETTATINVLTSSTTTSTATGSQTPVRRIQAAFLSENNNYLYLMSNSSVSASVASAAIFNSILAVLAASVLILLYVWFAFRKVQKPWRYGACAIIALLHDVLVVMGVFSILGWTLHIQIDSLFITALLTVVGFSVHDTIVVFDRIRENMQRRSSETFEQVVNASLVQTMSRSLNTSLTVLLTLSALTLFGGHGSVQIFTFALLIGILSGTYSSIFNASMLLVIWDNGEMGLWRFNRELREARLGKGKGRGGRRETRERELARSRG